MEDIFFPECRCEGNHGLEEDGGGICEWESSVCLGPRRYVIARLDAFRVLHLCPAWDFLDMYHKSDTFCMVFAGGGGGEEASWGGVGS